MPLAAYKSDDKSTLPIAQPILVDPNTGRLLVDGGNAATPTVSTFSSSTNAQIAAADTARQGVVLFNSGSGVVYVLLGSGAASSTNYSFTLNAGDLITVSGYTGEIRGAVGTGGSLAVTVLK